MQILPSAIDPWLWGTLRLNFAKNMGAWCLAYSVAGCDVGDMEIKFFVLILTAAILNVIGMRKENFRP
jgi:ABC-type uncharacterized transport system permease subunit